MIICTILKIDSNFSNKSKPIKILSMRYFLHREHIFYAWVALLMLSFNSHVQAQTDKKYWTSQYDSLNHLHKTKALSDKDYFHQVDSLTEYLTVSGLGFSNEELMEYLSLYKELAFKSPNLERNQAKYFRFLMNNAFGQGRNGEVLFYAEKNDQIRKSSGEKSFLIPYIKLIIWSNSKNYEKSTALYDEYEEDFSYLENSSVDSTNLNMYIQAMQFLFYTTKPMNKVERHDDILKVRYQSRLFRDKLLEYLSNNPSDKELPYILKLLNLYTDLEYFVLYDELDSAKLTIDIASDILYDSTTVLGSYQTSYENIFASTAIEYFVQIGDYETSKYYIDILFDGAIVFDYEKSIFYYLKSRLETIAGNYALANEYMDSVLHYKDQEIATAYSQVTDLLYAHTESEYNKIELELHKKRFKNQRAGLYFLGTFALAILLLFLFITKRIKRKNKEQIDKLNEMTALAIRETKQYTILEEQKRLGQDIHDTFSSALAAILHQIRNISSLKTKNQSEIQEQLSLLEPVVEDLYDTTRKKSHDIFAKSEENNKINFSLSIDNFLKQSLPENKFKTQVDLSDEVIASLDVNQRIELLKILSESITNVIKHSKSNEVSVFLFRRDNQAVFHIADNGIGIKSNYGFGLDSIQQRAEKLGGKLEVLKDEGTHVIVTFPIQYAEN